MSSPWIRAFEQGQAAHPGLAFDPHAFERRARAALARRLAPLGREGDEAALTETLAVSAVEDLWLALAVESCVQGAEARLRERLGPALEAAARRRGLVPARARLESARLLERVLSSPGATTTDRLGGYDGSAPLLLWLLALLEEGEQARAAEPPPGEPPAPVDEPARPHPHALFLAAAAQGRLLAGEEQALVQHLPGCRRCQEHLRGLALTGALPEAPAEDLGPAPRARVTARGPGAPAPRRVGALLLGLGIVLGVIGLAMRAGGRGITSLLGARGDDTERGVYDAARALARHEPGFFADFVPYPREQLEGAPTRPPGVDGRAVDLVQPLDEVLSPTPTLLWRPIEGVASYTVSVSTAEGQRLWERATSGHALAWPAEEPPLTRETAYVWEVRATSAEELVAAARFRVASERQLAAWERRRTRIEAAARDEAVRAVLLAQVALHRGHLWEAWTAIRAHLERVPRDDYGVALEGYLRRMHGFLE